MTRCVSIFLLLLVSVSLSALAQQRGGEEIPGNREPASVAADTVQVAVITSVHGSATLLRDSLMPVSVGTDLRRNDTLAVANGSLSLVFMSGAFATIVGGETLHLGSDLESCVLESSSGTRGPKLEGAVPVPASTGSRPRRADEWRRKLAYAAGVRGEAGPVALSPRLTMAHPHPVFVWFDPDSSAVGQQRSYTLVLRDDAQRTLLQRTVSGRVYEHNSYRLDAPPAGFAADSGRRYSWDVVPQGAAIPDGELDARCMYVDPAGLQAAAAFRGELDSLVSAGSIDTASARMMHALRNLDERERLFADAVPVLLELAQSAPSRGWAVEQLISVYLRFGNRPMAIASILQRTR